MANRFLTQVAKETTAPAPQLRMNLKEFMQKMAEFNKFGEGLYSAKKMSALAEELEELCTHAEAYALKEDETELFDNVTIKRNMGELKKYVGEFKKIASECDRLTQRSTALYEDMGRVLGRYYEIKDVKEFVDPYASRTTPADEAEKQVKNQPMNEVESEDDKYQRELDAYEKAHSMGKYMSAKDKELMRQAINPNDPGAMVSKKNESLFEVQRQLRKMYLREQAYLRTKARLSPEERQAMFNRIKNDKKLTEQITIEFGQKLMKEVENEVPYGDVVKLTTRKFNMNDDCEGFYMEMKSNGFDLISKIWEERPPRGPNMFIEFYVPKDQFNEANAMANRIAPEYQK